MTEAGLAKFKQTLKEGGSSSTKSRAVVFALLQQGPISMADLIRGAHSKADRATVYRAVELFEKLGIVNRIWYGSEPLVELSEIFTPHHHHALCQNCGRAVDLASSELEVALANLAKKHHFLAISHVVELSGYCNDCQR